ncbi:MAG: hypothetical protein AAF806_03540 [Bacteroidota bacterium]
MKKLFPILFSLVFLFSMQAQESLVIFTQASDTHFIETALSEIKDFANENGIEVIEKDAAMGMPAEITTTPAIIYQNARGRSIYSSRYAELSTIKNFIRTSKVVPQRKADLQKEQVLVWESGKSKIVADLKITEAKGKLPNDLNQAKFKEITRTIFDEHMGNFSFQNQVNLQRTDRIFYLDIHPYFGKANQCFLSLEIYSQYSCKDPIFSNFTSPLKGNSSDLDNLLQQAAKILEQEVIAQISNSTIGDAFSSIPKNVSVKTWKTLGLSLPQKNAQQKMNLAAAPVLPQNWIFHEALDASTPIVQFRFMAPLDRYVGEIKSIQGDLQFTDNQMKGNFVADMQSLTMGMESFDYNVLNKYVKAYKFPASSFEFSSPVDFAQLVYGETLNTTVQGTFELMRKKHPVEVVAQITPIVDATGQALLQVSASFELNVVDDFGIKGPDGPSPAREMMQFDLNFLMKDKLRKEK